MSRSAHLSFAFLLVAAAGCQSAPVSSGGYAVTSCSSSGDCADGATCTRDHCLETCATDAECPSGAVCVSGECYAGRFGACETDADCRSGELCVGGACAELPDYRTCTADSDCPAGTRCDAAGACEAVDTCSPVGEVCGNAIDDDCDGVVDDGCTPVACASTADCAAGQACVSGVCSAACASHETCGNAIDDDCNGLVDDGCSAACDAGYVSGEVCTMCGPAGGCGAREVRCALVCATDSDCGAPVGSALACVEGVCQVARCI